METAVENGATEPVAPAIADDGANGQPQGDSLEQRIQSDPAFALEQYKKVKAESTRLYQASKKHEAITKIADQLGGAEVAVNSLMEYAALLASPEVARAREHYKAHGTLPPATSTRTDDTSDEYKDPQQVEIEELRREIGELKGSISQTKGVIGKQAVTGMLNKLRAEYPDGFDEHILPKLESSFQTWERTPDGRELLAAINYDQLKTVASRAVMDNLDAIAELRHARVLESKKRAATGAPASNLSTGRELPVGKRVTSASEALADFKRTYGENYS